jgi:ubiquinone/menaquinone biosynthesis C-methylase UbiE
MTGTTTDLSRPRFARMYIRTAKTAEERGGTEHRKRLLDGLTGIVLEIGAGHGLNFPHYPAEVSEVIAIEPEPTLRARATDVATTAPVRVRVLAGVADDLPLGNQSVDAAVASLVLCSVPDQDRALAELRRVLRPGGELRFYEHVVANQRLAAGFHRLADATFWPRVAGGCHLSRDTGAAIERAGFTIQSNERFPFAPAALAPSIPHILGVARRP